jgi:MoxR-like ATPase
MMRISDGKVLLRKLVLYNLQQYEKAQKKGFGELAHMTYLVPFFISDPGCGKTALCRQVATEFAEESGMDFRYMQTIVAQYDAGEMAGLPFVSSKEYDDVDADGNVKGRRSVNRMVRMRPTYLPDIDDPHQQFGIYNLDELPQAFLANQNICSQIVNEYRVGEHEIPKGFTMCATGNKPENKAGTTSMPSHLRDRLMFIPIEADKDDFLIYAAKVGIDPRVRTYIRKVPDALHAFKVGQNAFPSPRSWEKVSAILSMEWDDKSERHIRVTALNGQIGEGETIKFEAWLRVADEMPDYMEVIARPKEAPIFDNKKADILYLLLATLADQATDKNVEAILEYVKRLPNQEFVMMWAKDCFTAHPELLKNKHVTAWKVKHASTLMF